MCACLNYCPIKGFYFAGNAAERNIIRAAHFFFTSCANIQLLYANVELIQQFPDEVEDTEILLKNALTNLENAMDNIAKSVTLLDVVGADKEVEASVTKALGNSESLMQQNRPFVNLSELEFGVDVAIQRAQEVHEEEGARGILKEAIRQLGAIHDVLSETIGKSTDIETMVGAFPRIENRVYKYKTFAYAVSQTYKSM